MIRVLLIDDNERFREAFARLLDVQPGLKVVARAGSLEEARRSLEGIDVALLDLHLPDGDGRELIGQLREASPGARVLIMSATVEEVRPQEFPEAGADGIIDKIAAPDEIAARIRGVRAG
jgi:DNA-binding NarL/FixJ family response regulator